MELDYMTTEPLDYIEELMTLGNWSFAEDNFNGTNCSGRDFMDYIEDKNEEQLKDWALLGFYCRNYKSIEGAKYG